MNLSQLKKKKKKVGLLSVHCKSEKNLTNHFVHLLPPLRPQS